MLASKQNDRLLVVVLILLADVHKGNALLKRREPDRFDFDLPRLFQPLESTLQVSRVSVRVTMREGSFILLEGEGVLEGK